jgi:hypothetical protein
MRGPVDRLSLRAFGRDRGVSLAAIQKSIHRGRLRKAVAYDVKDPFIANLEIAREEWAAARAKPGPQPKEARTLAEAQRQVAVERVRGLRLTNDQRRGLLLPADEVEKEWLKFVMAVRAKLLLWSTTLVDKLTRVATLEGVSGVEREIDVAVREVLTEMAANGQRPETKAVGRPRRKTRSR